MSKNILIPVDFTSTASNSFAYGIGLAAREGAKITLLHISEKENNKFMATKKMEQLVSSIKDKKGVKVETLIETGTVKQDISRIAQHRKSDLIILGIHDASGLRKVFGSRAMDVIAEGTTPFLTIQKKSSYKDIKNIAVTFDIEKESIQIVKSICSLFGDSLSTLHIVIGKHDDDVFKAKMNSQLTVVKKYLAKNKITCNVILLSRKNFLDNFVEFSAINDIQLLAATYYQNTFNIFSPKFVQNLIENKLNIPILTIGGNSVTAGSQYSFLTV